MTSALPVTAAKEIAAQVMQSGYALAANAVPLDVVSRLRRESPLAEGLHASRQVLENWPGGAAWWQTAHLLAALAQILGPEFGLVRGLFFDKPPARRWTLPWHKDLAIAVRDNQLPSARFTRPTVKGGVPHVIAPREILEQMLALRLHLDDVTAENGPLVVAPGSHHSDQLAEIAASVPVLAAAGDVLFMRPLLTHCSGKPAANSKLHRRVLHLEFAGCSNLPDGFAWHTFQRCDEAPAS